MGIAMNPHGWQRPRGRFNRGVPHPPKTRHVNECTKAGKPLLKGVGPRHQCHTANVIHRRVVRRRLMQGTKELREDPGRLIRTLQWGRVERFSLEPPRYHPEVWVLVARTTHVNGYGRRERKSRRKFGQPSHFVLEERDARLSSR